MNATDKPFRLRLSDTLPKEGTADAARYLSAKRSAVTLPVVALLDQVKAQLSSLATKGAQQTETGGFRISVPLSLANGGLSNDDVPRDQRELFVDKNTVFLTGKQLLEEALGQVPGYTVKVALDQTRANLDFLGADDLGFKGTVTFEWSPGQPTAGGAATSMPDAVATAVKNFPAPEVLTAEVKKAALTREGGTSTFRPGALAANRNLLSGELAGGGVTQVPQRSVFDTSE